MLWNNPSFLKPIYEKKDPEKHDKDINEDDVERRLSLKEREITRWKLSFSFK
jgi:hypothetical protein